VSSADCTKTLGEVELCEGEEIHIICYITNTMSQSGDINYIFNLTRDTFQQQMQSYDYILLLKHVCAIVSKKWIINKSCPENCEQHK
jgi:hypothetical protein